MKLNWTTEEKILLNMEKIIALAWRMNDQQLYEYWRKLCKKQQEILPGRLGSAFLKQVKDISCGRTEDREKAWTELMRDVKRLLRMIQNYCHADEKAWFTVASNLDQRLAKYSRTDIRAAFALELKYKMGIDIPETKTKGTNAKQTNNIGQKSDFWMAADTKKQDLEQVAKWLMTDAYETDDNKQTRKRRNWFGFIKKAPVPVFACLSVCFMLVWMYGQIGQNKNKWEIRQIKAEASNENEALMEESKKAESVLNYDRKKKSKSDLSIKKIQIQKQEKPQKLPQYKQMVKKYPNLFGWLQIPETQIDYPVMCAGEDKDFYLDHDFTGEKSAEGALFVDPKSKSWPQDNNIVIYGHNMKNGHIFGTLKMFSDPDFFQTHSEIHFDTLYESGIYKAVAVLKTRILNEKEQGFRYYQFFQYKNKKEFQQCLNFVEENRLFETDSTLRYGDTILMLSTCEYSQENGRLVVVAKKITEKR